MLSVVFSRPDRWRFFWKHTLLEIEQIGINSLPIVPFTIGHHCAFSPFSGKALEGAGMRQQPTQSKRVHSIKK
jgi:hypothetical protein